MSQSIGQTIRQLRKERNLTQEELAEQLNVTSQAVSKWENESGLPDISQIVPLANVFGVSTDVLFGTFGRDNDDEINKIIDKASEPSKKSNSSESEINARMYRYSVLNDALKIYPNNMKLLDSALSNGVCLLGYIPWGNDEFKASLPGIKDECIRIGNVILKYCTDVNQIIKTRSWLASLYTYAGDYEKAKEQTEYLPSDLWSLRGPKLARIEHKAGELDNEIDTRCDTVYKILQALEFEIGWLGHAYRDKGEIQKAYTSYKTFYEMIDIICGNDSGHLTSFFINGTYHENLAQWSMSLGNPDEAMDWIEKMYDYKTSVADNWKNGVAFDSPLLCSIIRTMQKESYNVKRDFIPFLNDKVFDSIRDSDRFKRLLEKVKSISE